MQKDKKPVWYKRRRNWIIAVLLIGAFFVIRGLTSGQAQTPEMATVTRGEVKEELVLSGELRATQNANLQFSSSGPLSWVGVKVGDKVTKGQPLMKLDTVILNAAYQQSLSTLRSAEANVNQIHDELKGKDSSETFVEINQRVAAEVARDKAYDSMVAAQKSLRDSTLVAPFAGIVAQIANESPGVNVSVGTPQITVVSPETLYFSVNADQTDVAHIEIGDMSEVSLDAILEKTLPAKVSQISFTPSTQDSGTVYPIRLTLSVDNSRYMYRVGMTGDARFVLSQKDNVLFVPTKFVKTDKTGKYIVVDDKGTKKYIEVGIEGDERVEVIGDISEGQTVYN